MQVEHDNECCDTHQMSDTPENVVYETVMHAVTVAESVVRELVR